MLIYILNDLRATECTSSEHRHPTKTANRVRWVSVHNGHSQLVVHHLGNTMWKTVPLPAGIVRRDRRWRLVAYHQTIGCSLVCCSNISPNPDWIISNVWNEFSFAYPIHSLKVIGQIISTARGPHAARHFGVTRHHDRITTTGRSALRRAMTFVTVMMHSKTATNQSLVHASISEKRVPYLCPISWAIV